MRKHRVAAFVVLIFLMAVGSGWALLSVVVPVLAQEVLTNELVIKMVKAKLADSLIIGKIQASKTQFDLTTDGLIALKEAGVSERVMDVMQKQAASTIPAPPPGPVPPAPPIAPSPQGRPPVVVQRAPTPWVQRPMERPPIYHVLRGEFAELVATIGEIQTTGGGPFVGGKVEFVLGGTKAGYRLTERQPTFFSSYTPAEAPLVRLKPGENDRNLKVGSSTCFPYVGCSTRRGVRAEDKIDVQFERDASNYYRLTPRQPLPPGEYGFVLTQEMAGAASGKIWDFGAD